MFWGKRKPAAQTRCSAKINDRAFLDFRGQRYLTLVEDVLEDQVHIAAPFANRKVVIPATGESVVLSLVTNNGLQRYSAKVLETKNSSVSLVILGDLRDLGLLQRRRYPRVSEKLTVRYTSEVSSKIFEADWSTSVTVDISAGGLQMSVDPGRKVRVGEILKLEISLPAVTIKGAGRVVRLSDPAYGNIALQRMGVEFTQIKPDDRDAIHRHVKNRQAAIEGERRKLARVRLTRSLEMEYVLENEPGLAKRIGHVFELSIGGLKFTSESLAGLESGVVLDMDIKLSERRVISAVGEVMHVVTSPDGGEKTYVVGVRYKYLDHKDLEAIMAFLV